MLDRPVRRRDLGRGILAGCHRAWLARTGSAVLGVAVLVLTVGRAATCNPVARASHGVYGTATVLLALFSPLAWDGRPGSAAEATWHAVLAAVAVAAYLAGVAAVRVGHGPRPGRAGAFDVVVLAASCVLVAATLTMPSTAGLTERLLHAAAMAWYGLQTVSADRSA
ncbi:hypothetical protein ACNHYB_03010 [Isoptericola jiangsuensis]|uniref:hypothetical protein n=1 Tax=Isoptericola jiangsuensis TaxID=548579 RepID=UPI003AB0E7B0